MKLKFKGIYIVALVLIIFAGCQTVTNAQEVNSFADCVAAGNPIMESYPEQCQHGDQVFVNEEQQIVIDDIPRSCTREYRPVCGSVNVQCVTEPCEPIRTTFANTCLANLENAYDITEGACVDEQVNLEGACLSADNEWLEESQECVGMGEEQCVNTGGSWNECASACRNDPDAEVCTLQCIVVCQY